MLCFITNITSSHTISLHLYYLLIPHVVVLWNFKHSIDNMKRKNHPLNSFYSFCFRILFCVMMLPHLVAFVVVSRLLLQNRVVYVLFNKIDADGLAAAILYTRKYINMDFFCWMLKIFSSLVVWVLKFYIDNGYGKKKNQQRQRREDVE